MAIHAGNITDDTCCLCRVGQLPCQRNLLFTTSNRKPVLSGPRHSQQYIYGLCQTAWTHGALAMAGLVAGSWWRLCLGQGGKCDLLRPGAETLCACFRAARSCPLAVSLVLPFSCGRPRVASL